MSFWPLIKTQKSLKPCFLCPVTPPPQTPGPAAYKVVDLSIYRQKPPQYSIKGRNFAPEENTKKPGPGAHYPERVRNIPILIRKCFICYTC